MNPRVGEIGKSGSTATNTLQMEMSSLKSFLLQLFCKVKVGSSKEGRCGYMNPSTPQRDLAVNPGSKKHEDFESDSHGHFTRLQMQS